MNDMYENLKANTQDKIVDNLNDYLDNLKVIARYHTFDLV